jgi:hypothetical protein
MSDTRDAKMPEPVAEYYGEEQWWFLELSRAADAPDAPPDLKRAVHGVVRGMITKIANTTPSGIRDAKMPEPVAAQQRFRHPQMKMPDWSEWQPATANTDRPRWKIDSQGYEVEYRLLYGFDLLAFAQSEHQNRLEAEARASALIESLQKLTIAAENIGGEHVEGWQPLLDACVESEKLLLKAKDRAAEGEETK